MTNYSSVTEKFTADFYVTLRINGELSRLFPPLRKEALETLEQSILNEGMREPLVLAKLGTDRTPTVLDGHNRREILTKHNIYLGEDYVILEDIKTIEQAKEWMYVNQLGRRNLTKRDFTETIGKLYNLRKKAAHRPKGGQNDPLNKGGQKTADQMAKEFDVSPSSIKRYAKKEDMKRESEIKDMLIAGDKVKDIATHFKCADRIVTKVRKQLKEEGLLKPKSKGTTPPPPSRKSVTEPPVKPIIKSKLDGVLNTVTFEKLKKEGLKTNRTPMVVLDELVKKYL